MPATPNVIVATVIAFYIAFLQIVPSVAQSRDRTTCPNDGKNDGACLEYLHRQPREFWERYQEEAPDLIDGVFDCEEVRNGFADWLRVQRQELWLKDRQENMVNGYLPHAVAVEADYAVNQMGNAFTEEHRQIINSGARPELCRERAAYWKGQILMILSKFPPLR